MFKKIIIMLLVLMTVGLQPGIVHAEDSNNANNAPKINWIEGPKTVDIGSDLAKLDLPSEYVFADKKDTEKLMKEFGNPLSGKEKGAVFSKDENQNWYVLFEFDDMGYVKDSDANKIDEGKILSDLKEGNEEANKERRKNGDSTIDIIGWDEKPHYDTKTHNLVWSVLCKSDGNEIVNYNVRILGRGGVTEVTLVADKAEMDKVKPNLETIVSKYSYKEGKRYSDYIKGDKVAEIGGLAALIAGGAGAAKIGLFAKIFIALKKFWILVIMGLGGLIKGIISMFRKKHKNVNEIDSNSDGVVFKDNPNGDSVNEISMTDSKSENNVES